VSDRQDPSADESRGVELIGGLERRPLGFRRFLCERADLERVDLAIRELEIEIVQA
jgi:hypothetical protein